MDTGKALIAAGLAGVGLYVLSKIVAGTGNGVPMSPPGVPGPGPTGDSLENKAGQVGSIFGAVTGQIVGAGPATGFVSEGGNIYFRENAKAASDLAGGAKQIVSGNVWSGAKSVGSGVAHAAYANTGAASVVGIVRKLF